MVISHNVKQLHNVWTPTEVLKYFYLSLDLQVDYKDFLSIKRACRQNRSKV